MEFPFYSIHEIWQKLSNSTIGFYTSKTKANIPDVGGIYAWFLPLTLSGSLEDVIRQHKRYFSYDSDSKGNFSREFPAKYQWQEFSLSASAIDGYKVEEKIEQKWDEIRSGVDEDKIRSMSQLLALSSVFTKPLYIGLAKNLASRYEQHTTQASGGKNVFYKRFQDFQKSTNSDLRIEDLLFVAIPVQLGNDPKLDRDAIKILEYLLKNIIGPMYGVK